MKNLIARCKSFWNYLVATIRLWLVVAVKKVIHVYRLLKSKLPELWETLTVNRFGLFLLEGSAFAGIFAVLAFGYVLVAVPILVLCAFLLSPLWAGVVGCILAAGGVILFVSGLTGLFFFLGLRYSDSRPMAWPQQQPQSDIEKLFGNIMGRNSDPVYSDGDTPDPDREPRSMEAIYSRKA